MRATLSGTVLKCAKWELVRFVLVAIVLKNKKSAECSLLRAEGFSCSLAISKLQFLIKKEQNSSCIFSIVGNQNP